jgi:hypothetical protein
MTICKYRRKPIKAIPKNNAVFWLTFLPRIFKAYLFTYHQILHSTILHGDFIPIICFMWLSERTVTFAVYISKSLVFITEVESVYSAVRTEYLYKTVSSF